MDLLGGSLSNLQPGVSGFIRRPLGPWSPYCYGGFVSRSPGRSDTTASLGGRGSCGLVGVPGAVNDCCGEAGLEGGLEPSTLGLFPLLGGGGLGLLSVAWR